MRASRLVSLLLLLQTRGRMTAAQLAEELEVSIRTIYRDVEALSESGVPIYAERGPHGGVRLVDGYRTRLTGLTDSEAEALFLSGLPGPAAELGLGTVVAAARLKVLAALPPELRTRASRISQRFHLDAPGWFQTTESAPHLQTLSTAVWEDRRLRIRYRRNDAQVVEREVEPLGLVLKAGVWYMVAGSGQARTYRVSRMEGATALEERFQRPETFDLGAYWSDSIAAYETSFDHVDVVLRVNPTKLDWLSDVVGPKAMAGAVNVDRADAEGWQTMRLRLDWPDDVHSQLLRMGAEIEVLEPADVRERMIGFARAVLARYDDSARPAATETTSADGNGRAAGAVSAPRSRREPAAVARG
jgi:predicted DNA-binding transcriptional regulator YafY